MSPLNHVQLQLQRRVVITNYDNLTPGLREALFGPDPWAQSSKYALNWVYFAATVLLLAVLKRLYTLWTDRAPPETKSPMIPPNTAASTGEGQYEMSILSRTQSVSQLMKHARGSRMDTTHDTKNVITWFLDIVIASLRFIFYRPIPVMMLGSSVRPVVLPSPGVIALLLACTIFTMLYCFVPQPLYWESIAYGSPPLAIRAGMFAVSLVPWLVALSLKANLVTLITGIGHERLNVLHRWLGWLCLVLSLIHAVPFYIQETKDQRDFGTFVSYLQPPKGLYVFGTGVAALVPLGVLCFHSLPWIRLPLYEVFIATHAPIAVVFLGMMFWHCNNYLSSWQYLFATVGIWVLCLLYRLKFLNWVDHRSMSWLIGEEANVHFLQDNAIKVVITTTTKWRPGQYTYLRMPGISWFESHPFTIASLCDSGNESKDGQTYREMSLVFRPYGGFTQRVLDRALEKGPWHTYRAFLDGPYGGMSRRLSSFDSVVMFAGGSGITAVTSHLLDLIRKMNDGRAVTRRIQVIWAVKRPETMEWFKEELRLCRQHAPTDSVECFFYITAAKRLQGSGQVVGAQTPSRPVSGFFHDKVDNAFQGIATKRQSHVSDFSNGRHSAMIADESGGNQLIEARLRREDEDRLTSLPQPAAFPPRSAVTLSTTRPGKLEQEKRRSQNLVIDTSAGQEAGPEGIWQDPALDAFDFGFPKTPTEFQKSLMRFAFLPAAVQKREGWSVEYGRPSIPYMLQQFYAEFGRRTCVFVCGPPAMRMDVSRTVAGLQRNILRDSSKEELYLHSENYSL